MFDDEERESLRREISRRIAADRGILDDLISDVRAYNLRGNAQRIQRYTIPSLAITSSDGGDHSFRFDPFQHRIIRVVDSSGQTLGRATVALSTDPGQLSAEEFTNGPNNGPTAVGRLMRDIGAAIGQPITELNQICGSIPLTRPPQLEDTVGWVQSYRELWEWAVLYSRIMDSTFAQSTLIILDGPLRTKLFSKNYFRIMGDLIAERIEQVRRRERKDIFLVGLAKTSVVIDRYRLALAVEDVFPEGSPYYVSIDRDIEAKTYQFPEYARGRERLPRPSMTRDPQTNQPVFHLPRGANANEDSKFVFGSLFFARFGPQTHMPTWAIDIFDEQVSQSDKIMAHLMADATDGFPIPCYPNAIQRAHDAAKLTDIDAMLVDDAIMSGIRSMLGPQNEPKLDRIKLSGDLTGRRY